MAFQINITPDKNMKKKESTKEPVLVTMAPFSQKSVVIFSDVPVTKTAKRILRILNPSDDEIKILVTKGFKPELNISMEWTSNIIPAQAEITMNLIWNPLKEFACKEAIQFTDNRNFKKDIFIIFKSIKKPKGGVKRFPNVTSISSNKSSTLSKMISPKRKSTISTKYQKKIKSQLFQTQNTKSYFPFEESRRSIVSPLSERNIDYKYEEHNYELSGNEVSSKIKSKENSQNISPVTPKNSTALFDKIKFTPNTETKLSNNLDYLASLPTPVNIEKSNHLHRYENNIQLRASSIEYSPIEDIIPPRENRIACVSTPYLSGLSVSINVPIPFGHTFIKENSILNNSNDKTEGFDDQPNIQINNRTFEKLQQKKNDSDTTLNSSIENYPVVQLDLNNTDPVIEQNNFTSRLSMIAEEEYLQKPNLGSNKFKRDIQLVGTPLRKYSESMKNLSTKSPQITLGIQGSMPNLNDMESLQSIEKNRYYYQQQQQLQQLDQTKMEIPKLAIVSEISDTSSIFNQNEILAASSRFNVNESEKEQYDELSLIETPKHVFIRPCKQNILTGDEKSRCYIKRRRDLESPKKKNRLDFTNSNSFSYISPPKRSKIDPSFDNKTLAGPLHVATTFRSKKWGHIQPKKSKILTTLSLVKKPITPKQIKIEPRQMLYDSDIYLESYINPDPFAATTTLDPFLATTMYLDERCLEKYENQFKKWLNALITSPSELNPDCTKKIDVGKLFTEVRNKELILAPTKEEQSMNYLTKSRMESLRAAAVRLFMSEEMLIPCTKICVHIKKNELRIRSDRDLHLDIVMQRDILELLLYFNPLWLRIGLEVVFGEVIHLHSNSDIVGLSTFILNRLFKDKDLENKYSKAYTLSSEYASHIKKFTLQKILFLLFFLDKAKTKRIIKHNPCLFVKKSPFKETKAILWKFSSELLASVGDITRELKRFGYVLEHKQLFLDEFDYAFKTLSVDLRDGIRLTRVAEIILLRDDLLRQVRSPAISRLQRIFNVDLALKALAENDFQLRGNILPCDIVDGHREKTLSLLWQIIYKFRAPKFIEAAKIIQKFWRHHWLKIYINRRIKKKIELKQEFAAVKIQCVFRSYIARKYTKIFKIERTDAAICLQKYCRRFLARRKVIICISSIIMIQRWYRKMIAIKVERNKFLVLKQNALILQNWYRRLLFARKLEEASNVITKIKQEAKLKHEKAIIIQRVIKSFCIRKKLQQIIHAVINYNKKKKLTYRSAAKIQSFFQQIKLRRQFLQQKDACTKIQKYWRSYKLMRICRAQFSGTREAILAIQKFYRSYIVMKKERMDFIELKTTTIRIQHQFRANKLCLQQRTYYIKLRLNTIAIQRKFRANKLMKIDQINYLKLKNSVLIVQNRFRAQNLMKLQFDKYQKMKSAAILIQNHFRGYMKMKQARTYFLALKTVTIRVQEKFRAKIICRKTYLHFLQLQYFTLLIQQTFRGNRLMAIEHSRYLQLKNATIKIQQYFRAKILMRRERENFLILKQVTILIQQKFRALRIGQKERTVYLKIKSSTLFIQRLYRANLKMRMHQNIYQKLLSSTIFVQRHYRALTVMRRNRKEYLKLKNVTILIQRLYRAKLSMYKERNNYRKLRNACILMQNRLRAKNQMTFAKSEYNLKRKSCIKIQNYFRSYLLMKIQHNKFIKLKESTEKIQIWYRSVLKMHKDRNSYELKIRSILIIQKNTLAYLQRRKFIKYKTAVIKIQNYFRAYQKKKIDRENYLKLRHNVLNIQQRYRSNKLMLKIRNQFLLIQSLTINLQKIFRSKKLMRVERTKFLELKSAALFIEEKYLANLYMKRDFEIYQQVKYTISGLQANCRGYLARKNFMENLMTPEKIESIKRKRAARILQKHWRGYRVRKSWKNYNLILIRERLRDMNKNVNKNNIVKFKISSYVKFLKKRFNVKEALAVLLTLENLSRTVPNLLMAHSTFISTFCYGIMAQAIRSEPDKQIIEVCGRIILNLARYNLSNIFQDNGLVTVAHMLLRWCDKECGIFNTLCTLIYVFAQCPQMNQKINSFMTTPEAIFMLRETKKLLLRKEKMLQNIRNPRKVMAQQQSYKLPHLEPDYGVIKGKPYVFNNSVYAFQIILMKLDINNIF